MKSGATRQELIQKIEQLRGSKVLVYVTSDRTPAGAQIGDDAVRPIVEHLRRMGPVEKLDLFIYSRGGAIDVPWRLNSAFRRNSERWEALVPFRANSAATLLCLGADRIVLGRHGELGPIDPIMSFATQGPTGPAQQQVPVEDIMAFPKFVADRFEVKDEPSTVAALNRLLDRLDAVTLGSAYRTYSHIRYLAEKMLASRNGGTDAAVAETIVETLAERVYAHGHAVGLEEAQAIGLHVESASTELESAMWSLLEVYETDLKLLEPLDPFSATQAQEVYTEDVVTSVIESAGLTHEFGGTLSIKALRQMPQSLQVQLNVPIQLPPGVNPQQLPSAVQQMVQQAQQALLPLANTAVQEALKAQAPISSRELRVLDARWREVSAAD